MVKFLENENEIRDYTFSEIKKSFAHHYQSCESYRKFCDFHEFTPEKLISFEDLYSIPQIPTSIFKSLTVCSADKDSCKCCTSSGTKGAVSRIYRDDQTIRAFLETIVADAGKMYGLTKENCVVFNLGPSAEEAGDIWLAYVTGFLRYAVETHNYMHGGVLETEKLLADLKGCSADKRIVLLGAPALFMRVFSDMDAAGVSLQLPENTVVFTAGGWKSKTGAPLTREALCGLFTKYFGIGDAQYFDVYNQVESNTPFFECRCHNKHIPAGFLAVVRDPVTFEKVEDGKEGVVSFLDSSSSSYPAFVITDDIGSVTNGCECGLQGQVFHYVRRVRTVETKGCALKLDQKMA